MLLLVQAIAACLPVIEGLRRHGLDDPQLAGRAVGELAIILVVRGAFAVPIVTTLTYALMTARYRARWFAFTLGALCLPLTLLFPFGSGFALFFAVYLFRHRAEFAKSADVISTGANR
ncbi:MAG TPA: hypothetical protein VK956_20210 [Verrucomicrobium sp.]|nr:hypothetical protein [Verrucomicrobium sp.]